MTCPSCKNKITQWENSWGAGNARCIHCGGEFRIVIDSQGMHGIPAQEPDRRTRLSFEQAVLHLVEGRRIGVISDETPEVTIELCLPRPGTALHWKRSDFSGPPAGTLYTFSDKDVLEKKYFLIEEAK